jgi:hypothetical protein
MPISTSFDFVYDISLPTQNTFSVSELIPPQIHGNAVRVHEVSFSPW